MVVLCIDDSFDDNCIDVVKNIITVGDEDLYLPKVGKQYQVIGFGQLKGENGELVDCYQLGGLEDTSENYGVLLLFKESRFITISDDLVPNHVDPNIGLCTVMPLYMDLTQFK